MFASRMLYEMLVDHNYAFLFDFQYNLIYTELSEEQKRHGEKHTSSFGLRDSMAKSAEQLEGGEEQP